VNRNYSGSFPASSKSNSPVEMSIQGRDGSIAALAGISIHVVARVRLGIVEVCTAGYTCVAPLTYVVSANVKFARTLENDFISWRTL